MKPSASGNKRIGKPALSTGFPHSSFASESDKSFPVTECLESLLRALREQHPVVLKAPPGAGKTTIVPPVILDSQILGNQQILVVQPRRLAATSTAARIAELRNEKIGNEVGYHVRFDKQVSSETKLLTLTTGILLRRLISDPLLEGVGCVVLDEFHERSIDMDLALGMIEQIRKNFRPELRLVVMSATLDPGPITKFLGDAVPLESVGKSYPVEIHYEPVVRKEPIEEQIASKLQLAIAETQGDVLVFLPGVGEILRVKKYLHAIRLQGNSEHAIEIVELYGSLSPSQQSRAIHASQGRKIVLATNVAETSVTIPGIESVIDTGTARKLQHDSNTGLPRLNVEPISKASADQRAGRAGRTGPGRCYRLWPQALQSSRKESDPPEILRGELSGVVLSLAKFGERELDTFPWLQPPPPHAVDHAKSLLQQLGAISSDGNITALGNEMVQLPISPRLARLMIEASRRGIVEEASIAASLLSERDPFLACPPPIQMGETDSSTTPTVTNQKDLAPTNIIEDQCDLWPRVKAIQAFESGANQKTLNSAAARQVVRVAQQLRRAVKDTGQAGFATSKTVPHTANQFESEITETVISASNSQLNPTSLPAHPSIRLRQSLLVAFPDRLAKQRVMRQTQTSMRHRSHHLEGRTHSGTNRGVLAAGKGVQLSKTSNVSDCELFLCLNMDSGGVEARVRIASGISNSWIDADQFKEQDVFLFDKEKQAVIGRRQKSVHRLVIHESPIPCKPSVETAKILYSEIQSNLGSVIPPDNKQLHDFAARIALIRKHFPSLGFAEINHEFLREILFEICHHHTSVSAIKRADWHTQIKSRYDYTTMAEINRLAPSSIQIPSGRSVEINYQKNKPPTIAVRIQEVFGWTETPRIAEGRVTILLHLLGPNGRPQQITDDLNNFWAKTYPEIKKELKRRYSKHHWPDDPLTATATRSGLKSRK